MKEEKKEFKEYSFDQILENRAEKKKRSLRFKNLLDEINSDNKYVSDKLLERIFDCGSFLEFITTADFEKNKVSRANFCGTRFCPHCAFNKSKKNAAALHIILQYLYSDYEFIFLTLTAPNISSNELENELREYSDAFNKLIHYKDYKNAVRGYFRKLEVTYNYKTDTYHPHYHVLLAVDKDYFDSDKYINQKDWLKLWKKAKKDENIKILDVRKFNKEKDTGVLELTKYIAKDSDYLYNAEVFKTFYTSLKGKRFYSLGGVFKDANIKYKNGELDYLKEKDTNLYIYKLWYLWNYSTMSYSQNNFMMLTPEELERYNIDFIDEADDLEVDSDFN